MEYDRIALLELSGQMLSVAKIHEPYKLTEKLRVLLNLSFDF